jgi:transcription elongation GreA/GreB family factor
MNKSAILAQFHQVLAQELATLTRAAQEAFAAATDPDSKAENKYDTRNLEASYIARGQAQRVEELQQAVTALADFAEIPRPARPLISLGALITLQAGSETNYYVIASHGGGAEIIFEGKEICLLTPRSPLGEKLVGRRKGETIPLRPGLRATILAVE